MSYRAYRVDIKELVYHNIVGLNKKLYRLPKDFRVIDFVKNKDKLLLIIDSKWLNRDIVDGETVEYNKEKIRIVDLFSKID